MGRKNIYEKNLLFPNIPVGQIKTPIKIQLWYLEVLFVNSKVDKKDFFKELLMRLWRVEGNSVPHGAGQAI